MRFTIIRASLYRQTEDGKKTIIPLGIYTYITITEDLYAYLNENCMCMSHC